MSRDGALTVLARQEARATQIGRATYEPRAGQLMLTTKDGTNFTMRPAWEWSNGNREEADAADDELRRAIEAGRNRRMTAAEERACATFPIGMRSRSS
jgi:hypothetical protein